MLHPDSSSWEIKPSQMYIEEKLDNIIEIPPNGEASGEQAEFVRTHIKRMWIHWAFAAGDPTYAKYTGEQPLYPKYVAYHDKTLEECQSMLFQGRAKELGMDQKTAEGLSLDLANAANKHEATKEQVAVALSLRDPNFSDFTHPMMIGEQDELQ